LRFLRLLRTFFSGVRFRGPKRARQIREIRKNREIRMRWPDFALSKRSGDPEPAEGSEAEGQKPQNPHGSTLSS